MIYSEEKMIGDLGEITVARAFIKYFRWPCRQQSIDVGIDCEVEVSDIQGNATGKVVKVQVKATMKPFKDGLNTFYLTQEHVDYWKQFSIPVLLCAVSLTTDEVLWKVIDPAHNYSTPKGAKVDFDRVRDALTPNSRVPIEIIALQGSDTVLQVLGLAECSMRGFVDRSGQVRISIEDKVDCDQHLINGEIIRMAYRIFEISGQGSNHPAKDRLDFLNMRWNNIDRELSSQAKADFY